MTQKSFYLLIYILLSSTLLWAQTEKIDSLYRRFVEFYQAGNYQKAIPLGEELLKLCVGEFGPDHENTGIFATNLASAYEEVENYERAEALYLQAISINREDSRLSKYGNLLAILGRYEEAAQLLSEALKMRAQFEGATASTAQLMVELGGVYEAAGRDEYAAPVYARALEIFRETLDGDHGAIASLSSRLMILYYRNGQFKESLSLAELSLETCIERVGPEHPVSISMLGVVADNYHRLGRNEDALTTYERVLELKKKVFGRSEETADTLNALASVHLSQGDFTKAIDLLTTALEIQQTVQPRSEGVATVLHNLGTARLQAGELEGAEELLLQAVELRIELLGPEREETLLSFHNLAQAYVDRGLTDKAEETVKRALKSARSGGVFESSVLAGLLNTHGEICSNKGDLNSAAQSFEHAISLWEATEGPDSVEVATALFNLAKLHLEMADLRSALETFMRSCQILEDTLGPGHPKTLSAKAFLAEVMLKTGQVAQAESLLESVLPDFIKWFGPEHPKTAMTLNNLAMVLEMRGREEEAEEMLREALRIRRKVLPSNHPDVAASLRNLALLKGATNEESLKLLAEAIQMEIETYGVGHEAILNGLGILGKAYYDAGRLRQAKDVAELYSESLLARTENIFRFASERQRLAYRSNVRPFDMQASLGQAEALFDASLKYKGIVLDSTVEDLRLARAALDAETKQLAEKVSVLKKELYELNDNWGDEARMRESVLRRELQTAENELSRSVTRLGVPRRAFSIETGQVQSAMPKDSALVEFIKYRHLQEGEPRYCAVVLPKSGPLVFADIPGNAEEIEMLIAAYQAMVRGGDFSSRFVLSEQSATNSSASALLSNLYKSIWEPIEEVIPVDTETVILSPDGKLNFLSFATLVSPEDSFLAEKYLLAYVSSGRDLVAETVDQSGRSAALFGNPSFGDTPMRQVRIEPASEQQVESGWEAVNFLPLPHTQDECKGLEALLVSSGRAVSNHLEEGATEESLIALNRPELLHLATHGFFLPAEGVASDPMYRSGLALVGAQDSAEALAKGEQTVAAGDGLLMAAEVGLLDLSGTSLVALSACDTGSGESRDGEGVLGLRRGFVQSGARNLLMTLWPVADKETAEFMVEFYQRALKDKSAPIALASIQRDWLVRLKEERSVDEAVRLAGPFVLTFQGRLE